MKSALLSFFFVIVVVKPAGFGYSGFFYSTGGAAYKVGAA
jgi:hypothetical protein